MPNDSKEIGPDKLQDSYAPMSLQVDKNTIFIPIFVAEYFTNKKIDEEWWTVLNNLVVFLLLESNTSAKRYDELLENGIERSKNVKNVLVDDYIRLSDKLVQSSENKILIQNSDNLDELYKAAEIADKELKIVTNNFALETEGKAGFRDGLKSRERALEKIESDYFGDASRLVDIAGSKVVYETVEDLYFALNEFNKKYKILKIKDRIQKPLNGYRDVLINIEMKNGHIVEFRLHLKAMDEVAETGHKLYEEYRTLEALSKTRNLTDDEVIRMIRFEKKQFELYEQAWKKIIN